MTVSLEVAETAMELLASHFVAVEPEPAKLPSVVALLQLSFGSLEPERSSAVRADLQDRECRQEREAMGGASFAAESERRLELEPEALGFEALSARTD